jgi:hypothetical protein
MQTWPLTSVAQIWGEDRNATSTLPFSSQKRKKKEESIGFQVFQFPPFWTLHQTKPPCCRIVAGFAISTYTDTLNQSNKAEAWPVNHTAYVLLQDIPVTVV